MSGWGNVRVLVLGGGGFIGSHLTDRLLALGADVRALVRKAEGLHPRDRLTVVRGSLGDAERVREAARGVDVVFHLAAVVGVPYSCLHPEETIDTNVVGTLNVLTAARDEGVRKVVQTSTSEVYGPPQYLPIDEKHPKQPRSPYAASKIASDALALSFHHSFGLPVAVIRPFNTYGPRQSARAVIPTMITQALTQSEIKLGNLETTRDFTYVGDVVDGFLRVAEAEASIGREINIGSGVEVSIGELCREIIAATGRDVTPSVDAERIRPAEVPRLRCDPSLASELLGWQPRYTLADGLRETIAWFGDPDHLQRFDASRYTV